MSDGKDVGGIVYQVDMELGKLITSQQQVPALFRWMLFKGMQLDYPAHVIVVFSRMLVPVVLLG
ncbi:TPA: hypothetical protein PXM46_001068 [Yersinia enterocolitica]|nr:hypothetical protein [Yersinia enterocolitica]